MSMVLENSALSQFNSVEISYETEKCLSYGTEKCLNVDACHLICGEEDHESSVH